MCFSTLAKGERQVLGGALRQDARRADRLRRADADHRAHGRAWALRVWVGRRDLSPGAFQNEDRVDPIGWIADMDLGRWSRPTLEHRSIRGLIKRSPNIVFTIFLRWLRCEVEGVLQTRKCWCGFWQTHFGGFDAHRHDKMGRAWSIWAAERGHKAQPCRQLMAGRPCRRQRQMCIRDRPCSRRSMRPSGRRWARQSLAYLRVQVHPCAVGP